jgi:hypothetical protein
MRCADDNSPFCRRGSMPQAQEAVSFDVDVRMRGARVHTSTSQPLRGWSSAKRDLKPGTGGEATCPQPRPVSQMGWGGHDACRALYQGVRLPRAVQLNPPSYQHTVREGCGGEMPPLRRGSYIL